MRPTGGGRIDRSSQSSLRSLRWRAGELNLHSVGFLPAESKRTVAGAVSESPLALSRQA